MTYDEIKTAWDVQAGGLNQWDSLGEDEKVEMNAFKVGEGVGSQVENKRLKIFKFHLFLDCVL